MSIIKIKDSLISSLNKQSNLKQSQGMAQYLKYIYVCRGIRMPDITKIFKEHKNEITSLSQQNQYDLGIQMLQQLHSEDKYLGAMVLGGIKMNSQLILDQEKLFIDGHILDWSVCDAFCGRVLKRWLKESVENAKHMIKWSTHECLQLRRASCVGFVTLCKNQNKEYYDVMYQICHNVVLNQQRFNQLGCGWLIRILGEQDRELANRFIRKNIQHFSPEGLRYATEKMNKTEIQGFKELRREQMTKSDHFNDLKPQKTIL